MKKKLLSILLLLGFSVTLNAQIANHVVISEVYGAGGNSGATYKNDFIELYNPTPNAISLVGWSVQYASATGTASWAVTNITGTIPAKGFYLIQEATGTGGTTNLPTPNAIGMIAMAAANGKVILCNVTTAQSGANPTSANIIDKVGYGSANGFETAPTGTSLTSITSVERKASATSDPTSMSSGGSEVANGNGYDSDDNSLDFIVRSPEPQNSASPTEGAVNPNAPSIVLSPSSLSFGAQNINTVSIEQSFTITTSNLDNTDINLAVSAPYSISKTSNGSYSGSLNYTAIELGGGAPTVFVKFSPTSTGTFSSSISITGGGTTGTTTLALTGAGTDPNQTAYDFNDCTTSLSTGFTAYSVTGAQQWTCTTFGRNSSNGINMNGFASGNNLNEDWLISPAFDFTSFTYPILSFYSRGEFGGPSLQLKVSTNYPGTGDPTAYTWTSLNGYFPDSGASIWTLSDNIDLSTFKQAGVYVAFIYNSTTSASPRWTLDDFSVLNSATPAIPLLFTQDGLLQYKYVAAGSNSDKTTNISFANLTNDVTLTSTDPAFTLSEDGTNFSSSLPLLASSVNNSTKMITVRFNPTQNNTSYSALVNITSTGAVAKSIQLTGDTYNATATLDVVNWNMEWFGSTDASVKPSGVNVTNYNNTQQANAQTILQGAGADIYGLAEVVDEARLAQIVANMPGYSYVISDYGSYGDDAQDPDYALDQKLAYVYKTAMFSNITTQGLMRCTEAVNCAAWKPWASGRFPYLMSADVTANGFTQKVNFVMIHAKANTGDVTAQMDAYNRRKTGADLLKGVLDAAPYNLENVIVLGDYNDVLDQTIAPVTPNVSSYSSFVNDNVNYSSLTLPLSLAGLQSTAGFKTVIDNVIVSNELASDYISNSASILTDLAGTIPNYSTTTSDHYPVQTRYIFTSTTLPIHLTSFSAKADGNKVELKWTTASEENNDHFTVEHSADGKKFTEVGQVKGPGNSSSSISYVSYDDRPLSGVNYYRLKQTDFNGNYSYSDIKAVTMLSGISSKLIVFPNPLSDKITLSLQTNNKAIQLSISSIDGQVIFKSLGTLDLLNQKLNADLSKWPAGIYFLQINDGQQVYNGKFIKE